MSELSNATCKYALNCPFYNDKMPVKPNTDALKKAFCEGDYLTCARFHAASESGCVADDLYPDKK